MQGENAVIDTAVDRKPGFRFNHGLLNMRVARDGTWFYHGSPIPRKEMVCLFASMLTRRDDGNYWLVGPGEEGIIEVEDVPFLAVEMFRCGSGRDAVVSFRTNVDEIVTLNGNHPLRVDCAGAAPYIFLRTGIEARLVRSVYYDMVSSGVEETVDGKPLYGIWSAGQFFPLGCV